ncbi:AMP-binding protein [Actinokineospora sp.]|uniref:AMP-binding protein n=1 Tax=Actinokineospora sp. TaxID=1872133 RepID=UPI00403816BD
MDTRSGLVAAVAGHAAVRPDAPALGWRGKSVGYADLWSAVDRERARIHGIGLPAAAPLAVPAAKSPETVALALGALAAGHPVLLAAPTHPETVLAAMYAAAGCVRVIEPDAVRVVADNPQGATPAPAGTGFMLATSGSTGPPKIVPLPLASVDAFTAWAADRFDIGPGVAVLSYAPLSFDLSLLDLWTTLAAGATAVLVPAEDALQPARLAGLLRDWRVRVVQGVPMLHGLLTATGDVFESVEHLLCTGDTMPPGAVAALPAAFPNARLHNVYGCTETNDSLVHEIDPAADGPVPLGDPLPGVSISIVDSDGREVTGPGSGELWVRTPFQSTGYLGAGPGGRFAPHPADPNGPDWYRSGDLVRRRDCGALVLVGRGDFRVKVRGVGVDLAEVEHALLSHEHVLDAVALAEPDPLGGKRLLALARRAPGSGLNSLRLRRHCAAVLPRGALPQDLLIVDGPLPRNANGKVDRAAVARADAEWRQCGAAHPEGD